MNIRKRIRIPLRYFSIFILASCSKTDSSSINHGVIPNEFSYTVTDVLGEDVTFSGSTTYVPDSDKYAGSVGAYLTPNPAAWITPPDTGNNQMLNFLFSQTNVYRNSLTFSLPYFQASLSETDYFLQPPLTLEFYRRFYVAAQPDPRSLDTYVELSSFNISTNISDSTDGFVTGSFKISATTVNSEKILISGKFSHLPSNYTYR